MAGAAISEMFWGTSRGWLSDSSEIGYWPAFFVPVLGILKSSMKHREHVACKVLGYGLKAHRLGFSDRQNYNTGDD